MNANLEMRFYRLTDPTLSKYTASHANLQVKTRKHNSTSLWT